MSVWQYMAALDGYAKANDPEGDKKLSSAEEGEIWDWLQSKS